MNSTTLNSEAILVKIDDPSIREIISPTPFDWLTYGTTIVLAGGLIKTLRTTRRLRRKLTLDISKLNFTAIGDSTYTQNKLKKLGQIGLDLQFAGPGVVGYLSQLRRDWIGDYFEYRDAVIAKGVVSREWFAQTWDSYFVSASQLNTNTLYLVQTSIIANLTRHTLNLTIVKDYYKLSFEWSQARAMREGEKYLYKDTFEIFFKRLSLVCQDTSAVLAIHRLYDHLEVDKTSDCKY